MGSLYKEIIQTIEIALMAIVSHNYLWNFGSPKTIENGQFFVREFCFEEIKQLQNFWLLSHDYKEIVAEQRKVF
jgi:hypothetical protein